MMKKMLVYFYRFELFFVCINFKGRFINKKDCINFDCVLDKKNFYAVQYSYKSYVFNKSDILFFKNYFQNINFFFKKKLNLIGIGFRCWTFFEKNDKFLLVKSSLSNDCLFYIPKKIDVYCLNYVNILILGLNKLDVISFAHKVKKIKKINFYKKKGIFFENENVKLKIGKKM